MVIGVVGVPAEHCSWVNSILLAPLATHYLCVPYLLFEVLKSYVSS